MTGDPVFSVDGARAALIDTPSEFPALIQFRADMLIAACYQDCANIADEAREDDCQARDVRDRINSRLSKLSSELHMQRAGGAA